MTVSWRFRRSTKPPTKPPRKVLKWHETVNGHFAVINIIYPQSGRAGFVTVLFGFVDFLFGFVWFRTYFRWFRMVSYGFVIFFLEVSRKSLQEIKSFFSRFSLFRHGRRVLNLK